VRETFGLAFSLGGRRVRDPLARADERAAQERVDVVERALREGFARSGMELPVSIGVTTYSGGEGGDRLLSRADQAKSEVPKGGVRFLRAPSPPTGVACPN